MVIKFLQIPVEQIIVHNQYSPRTGHANDIALLRLSSAAHINTGVSNVCLPISPSSLPNLDGKTLTAFLWIFQEIIFLQMKPSKE